MQVKQLEDLAYKVIEYRDFQDLTTDSKNSIFAPYQLAVKFTVHPLSDKYRFLVNHSTGSGKTLTSMLVARNFLNYGQLIYIITFNQTPFLNELMTVPELEFVTQVQLDTMKNNPDQVESIRRQIQRKINKSIVFMGYKELFLNLFQGKSQGGNKLNMDLVNRFRGSLVICDEIHNVYNNQTKNSYGVSVQVLSYILGKQVHMLFLSATPLNYSNQLGALLNIMQVQNLQQEQVVELVNVLESQNLFTSEDDVNKNEVFDNLISNLRQCVKVTKQNAPQLIKQILKDRVSFIPEIKKDFPVAKDHGVSYKAISNIIIKKCNISPLFREYMMNQPNYLEGKECKKSILIHPTLDLTEIIELARRSDVKVIKWIQDNKMQIVQSVIHPTLTGPFLKASNIGQYSPKLGFLISELLQITTKSFIYVNKIQGFGIDLIAELFKVNGILLFDSNPSNVSICFKCKKELRYHDISDQHEFIPYRAIVVTGSNASQADEYLSRFNSIENHFQVKYQIVLGNIKIKESYNIMEVNNSYTLTLPFNITNYIQVLGRCIRNKSHINMPPNLQYVNNYLLANTIEESESLSSNDFQDLVVKQKESQFYGRITREELDIWDKSLDFKLVQEYEQLIHSQTIDLKYFYPVYLKSKQDTNDPDMLVMQSENMLKMLPFKIEKPSIQNEISQDLLVDHKDLNLDNFFLLNISGILNKAISNRIKRLFASQSIWELEKLIDAIIQDKQPPNIAIVPRELVKQKIFTNKNTHIVDKFAIFSNQQPSMNFFLQDMIKSPILSLPILKEDYQPINQQQLVFLFKYLEKHFKQYVDCIAEKKIPIYGINTQNIIMTNEQQQVIFSKLIAIFGKTQFSIIRQQYEKMIRIYNQQRADIYQKESQAIMFIACINFMLPLTFETLNSEFRSKNKQLNTSKLVKTPLEEDSDFIKRMNEKKKEQDKSERSYRNKSSSYTIQYRSIIISGYIVDLNTQIFMSLTGEPSIIKPQREYMFPSIKKQLKIIKLQVGKADNVKQSGFNCMNLDKDSLQDILKKQNVSKQEHCDLILQDSLLKHFTSIVNFQQYFKTIFTFIDQ